MQAEAEGRAPDRRDERFLFAGVFLVSLSVLLLQIALTRLFSFTIWHHFAYVTISVALLGYGASGAFLAVLPGLAPSPSGRRLSLYAASSGLAIVLAFVVIARVPFHPFRLFAEPTRQIPWLALYYGAVTLPFLFAGLCISVALHTLSHRVSRLYFFDLLGAGAGCLLVVSVIWWASTPGAVIVSAVTVSLAGVIFAASDGHRAVGVATLGTVGVAALGCLALARVEFAPSPDKFLHGLLADGEVVRTYGHRWTPIFRTDVVGWQDEERSRSGAYASWGLSPHWKDEVATRAPRLRFLTHDGDAGAPLYNFDGDLSKLEMFEHLTLKTPYLVLEEPDVLVIGVGGGTDIVNAIKNGARHVTGIELDPETVAQVKVHHAEFAGRIYDRPDVTMIVGEGRSTLRHSKARYDLIQMTGVDTLAALSTGAYVLSESFLYTTEAVNELLDHLTPDGLLSIGTADFDGSMGLPRHSLRQISLFVAALDERGIERAADHVAVLASPEPVAQVAMLLKEGAFTPEQRARVREFADRMGFRVWALPGELLATPHSRYLHATSKTRQDALAGYPLVLTPTTDDRPFFFNFYRWRDLPRRFREVDVGHTQATGPLVLASILLLSILASALLILLPLLVFRRRGLATRGRWGFITFFVAIGLGFILVEISSIQRFVLFLGYPTYSLTVVLFSLLSWSGVGSWLTGRMRGPAESRLLPLLAGLVVVGVGQVFLIPALFDALLGEALALRVIVASAALLPLGLLMGMFFPTGIQIVRRASGGFVPWAWGVNGCASVVGTVLAVVLAMTYGFRAVTWLALVIYLIGGLALRATASRLPVLRS